MKQKLNELQIYSGIAILFVVLIHTNYTFLMTLPWFKYADIRWMFYYLKTPENSLSTFPYFFNLIDKITHVAVPMFIFIAGYKYAYNDKISYKEYFAKKLHKVFKPFLLISLFFIIINFYSILIIGKNSLNSSIMVSAIAFIKIFLGINKVSPLWYIPMYLLISLSYPIINKIIKNDKIRLLLFIVLGIFWVLADLFIPFVKAHQLPFCFIYYFYIYELGIIFCKKSHKNINGKYSIGLYFIVIILSGFVRSTVLNIILTETIITPLAVIAFYYISLKIKDNGFFSFLGKYSFYIFLLHEPIIERKLSYFLFTKLYLNYFYPSILPISLLIIFASIVVYKLFVKFHINKIIF